MSAHGNDTETRGNSSTPSVHGGRMASLSDAVNLLRAAAEVAENGHAAGARRIAEHAVRALLEVESRTVDASEVAAKREWNVGNGEG